MSFNSNIWSIQLQRSRWQSGLTVQQLAEKADVSAAAIRMAEAGSLDVDLISLYRIADALEVNVREIVCETDAEKISSLFCTFLERMVQSREAFRWRFKNVLRRRKLAVSQRERLLAERDDILRQVERLDALAAPYRLGFKIPSKL